VKTKGSPNIEEMKEQGRGLNITKNVWTGICEEIDYESLKKAVKQRNTGSRSLAGSGMAVLLASLVLSGLFI
jgi:hypothetical protein